MLDIKSRGGARTEKRPPPSRSRETAREKTKEAVCFCVVGAFKQRLSWADGWATDTPL